MRIEDFDANELARGTIHELEHTDSFLVAMEIAADHLVKDPGYYEALEKMEARRKRKKKSAKRKKNPRFTLKRGGSSRRMNQRVRDMFRDLYDS
jgi:hypothetical protein